MRTLYKKKLSTVLSTTAMSLIFLTPAMAIDQIVVTSQRRAQNIQDVPIAVTAWDAKQIARNFIDLVDVADATPNVVVNDFLGFGIPQISIRGIGQSEFNSQTSTQYQVYYDSVPVNSPLGASVPQWDMQRIEVLKGPQGTLFGRNSTAGAIQNISEQPTDDYEAYAEFKYGRFNLREERGAISGALTDNIKGRLSFVNRNRGGNIYDTFLQTSQGGQDWWGVRGIVDWQATDDLDVVFKAQYFKGKQGIFFQSTIPVADSAFPAFFNAIGFTNPGPSSNYQQIQNSVPDPSERIRHQVYSIDLNYDFGPVKMTAIGGYIAVDSAISLDNDASPVAFIDEHTLQNTSQWSAEVRFTSQYDSPFQWIVGGFYLQEDSFLDFNFDETTLFRDANGNGLTRTDVGMPGFDPLVDSLDGIFPGARNPLPNDADTRGSSQNLETFAFFAHTTFKWTDKLTTTHALRWTTEKKDFFNNLRASYSFPTGPGLAGTNGEYRDFVNFAEANNDLALMTGFTFNNNFNDPTDLTSGLRNDRNNSKRWNKVTGRFSAEYRFNENVMAYASFTEGFKGGSFASGVSNANEISSADPETVHAFEGGFKTDLFDGRVRFNASGFYYKYRDFQTIQLVITPPTGGGGPIVANLLSNIPKTRVDGFEVEVEVNPIEHASIITSFGYVDTEITQVTPGNEALLGNELPLAADYSFNVIGRYDFVTPYGTFSPQVTSNYRGNYFTFKENVKEIGGFWRTDLRLFYETPDSKIYGTFEWRNIADKRAPVALNDPSGGLGFDFATINARSSWSVSLGYRF